MQKVGYALKSLELRRDIADSRQCLLYRSADYRRGLQGSGVVWGFGWGCSNLIKKHWPQNPEISGLKTKNLQKQTKVSKSGSYIAMAITTLMGESQVIWSCGPGRVSYDRGHHSCNAPPTKCYEDCWFIAGGLSAD